MHRQDLSFGITVSNDEQFLWTWKLLASRSKRRGFLKNLSTQHGRIFSFSQATTTVLAELEDVILVTFNAPTGKPMEYSAACKIQNIKQKGPFHIAVANISCEKKVIYKK